MGIHVIKVDNVSNGELHEGSGESPTYKHIIACNTVLLKWRPCLGLLISATVSAAGPSSPPTLLLTAGTWTLPGVRPGRCGCLVRTGPSARSFGPGALPGWPCFWGCHLPQEVGKSLVCVPTARGLGEDSDPWGFDSEVHDT